jgi:predicted 3-demethylubiquinone-9 3-methyltransferase (glyoxalase superfamily)
MPKTVPWLWFENEAEQAAALYTEVFPDSKITEITHYGPDMGVAEGTVMTVGFTLDGQDFVALNGHSAPTFSEATSFQIQCADQGEIDHYWTHLSDGGEQGQCGWLKDRFGVSWQVVPTMLRAVLDDPDPERGKAVTQAMLHMRKLDIAELRRAADRVRA